jgi:hypothetical protein
VLLIGDADATITSHGGLFAHAIADIRGFKNLSITIAEFGVRRAMTGNETDKMMAMIRHGASVNIVNDKQKWTPLLHVCALSSDLQYVR